jgi:hypothetical protein
LECNRNKKRQGAKTETAKFGILEGCISYTRKDQIGTIIIREELNTFNLNNKILKSRSQWKYRVQRMEDKLIPKKILTQTKKKIKHRTSTVKMEGPAYSSENGTDHAWHNP